MRRLVRQQAHAEPVRVSGSIHLAQPLSWYLITAALIFILLAALVFLTVVSFSRSELAAGEIVPDRGILQIVPRRAGRVESLLVREGQLVPASAPLARFSASDYDQAGGSPQSAISNAIGEQIALTRDQETAERSQLAAQIAGHDAQIASLRNELASIDSQILAQQRLVSIARADFERAREIAQRGFVSARDVSNREDELLQRRQQLAGLQQQQSARLGALRQAAAARRQADARMAALQASMTGTRARLSGERASARAAEGFTLVAPAAGQVSALAVHEGDSVPAGASIMAILPAGSQLVARLYVPARAIGFVSVGQEVRIALDAYPQERFGTIPARITELSSAPRLRASAGGERAPEFIATALLSTHRLAANGQNYPLRPGMTLRARIVTEKRRLIAWMIAPLLAETRR